MADRVLVHDRTCRGRLVGLSTAWAAGSRLYRTAGRLDDAIGVASWGEAFAWLEARDQPIAELQFWGHGTWGVARLVNDDRSDRSSTYHGFIALDVLADGRPYVAWIDGRFSAGDGGEPHVADIFSSSSP